MSKTDRTYLRIPDKNGDFTIIVKRFYYEGDESSWSGTYYFQPFFRVNGEGNRIIRKDCLWEYHDVVGLDSKGFMLSNEEEFKEYCRKKFQDFRDTLCINPFSKDKEPKYTDDVICSLEMNW
ncbi:hypothetical protein [Helicobacter sp. MIT 05-5294]|uniref:hypothetical protein n=1 Tax=Helicobacter sp. MIT 05-5294 TaxID=1548150 RepID=UPI00051FA84B|nr:hypothetical protein [Helicobacter sp. MIT 05-5294]TLD85475.1 hypothetical protein LS69_009405 [Helicobacter sp. MIT 05-5294]